MWTFLASFLSGPLLGGILKAYQSKLAATNTTQQIDATLAARELAVQETEIKAQAQLRIAEIGRWYEPDHLASYVFVAYIAKVVVYDVMLGLGSTDAIHGSVGDWLGLIAMFLFGKRGAENIARILKR